MLTLVRRVPAWLWLAGLVVASALVRYALARRVVAPWIMVDELIYSELAKSFADSGDFLLRERSAIGYGFVYPVVVAPAFAAFDSIPDAYEAAKAINALVMSLAAVPAYLLARRVLAPGSSLLAAALAVALPGLAYTATLMTENAFYPLFLLVALALVAYLERPTALRAALVLAAIGLAWATRAQALVLVPAVLTAPLLLGIRRYGSLYALTGIGAVAVGIGQLLRGRSLSDLLGAYEPVRDRTYEVGATLKWLVYHAGELELSLGVVPVVATVLLAFRWRRLSAPVRALLAATASLTAWLLLAVAAFAAEVPVPPHVMERNAFYVAPLFFVALLVWIDRGHLRAPAAAVPALAVAALPAFLPYDTVIGPHAVPDTPGLLLWWRLADGGIALSNLWPLAAAATAAAAALVLAVPRRFAFALPLAVLAFFVVATPAIYEGPHGFRTASQQALAAGIGDVPKDWIDRAADADVAAVWSGHASPHTIWQNEFFNRRLGTVYRVDGPLPGALPEEPLDGARAEFALADGTAGLAGAPISEDPTKGLTLYRVRGRLEPIVRVTGIYPNDTWSGPRVTYTRTDCGGGTLAVTVLSDPALFGEPQTVNADGSSARVRPGGTEELAVELSSRGGVCAARFSVAPTARVPGDPRELGLHFTRFLFRPRPG